MREHERSRKILPDGMEERAGKTDDADEEELNLHMERAELALGRSARDAPVSVHRAITRHKQQARYFAKGTEAARTESVFEPEKQTPDEGRGHAPLQCDGEAAMNMGVGSRFVSPGAMEYMPLIKESSASRSKSKRPGKLQFSANEAILPTNDALPDKQQIPAAADKKLKKAQNKAEHAARRLEAARNNMHQKQEVRIAHPVEASANAVNGYVHTKAYQAEHENVGIQAAHKSELLLESGMRELQRCHKTRPYRMMAKLERKTSRLKARAAHEAARREAPDMKGGAASRMAQKRKIKRQYTQTWRKEQKAVQNMGKVTGTLHKRAVAAVRAISRRPALFVMIAVLFLFLAAIASFFSSCSGIASGIGTSIFATSYLAEEADLDHAELSYTEWEADLKMQINKAESDYPGYDEYRYEVDDIGHGLYELLAYLTATQYGFTYHDVEAILREVFSEQYQLTFIPSVERRSAGADGDSDADDWHILTIKLDSRPFYEIISSRMDEKQLQHYDLLMQSKGNRQFIKSPFDFDWSHHVTSRYGYRVHPISGLKDYHKAVDIGVPIGTKIYAGHDGIVSFAGYSGGYGYVVVIEDDKGLVTKYAHCDSLLVEAGQTVFAGDVIANSGNSGNSTGPHLHFEIIQNGQYLNPLIFSLAN